MNAARNTKQPSSAWRARLGAASIIATATLALAPLVGSIAGPVPVRAAAMQPNVEGCDFATSGGFVVAGSTKKNFGVHGGCKNGDFWGHLNFLDHANGYHVQSVAITGYVTNAGGAANARDVCGFAQTNNPNDPETVAFVARLVDAGEPGSADRFGLKIGYAPEGLPPVILFELPVTNLGTARPGGNVQLHRANASTAEWPVTYGSCAFSFDGGNPE
jgi:hypothetical protein